MLGPVIRRRAHRAEPASAEFGKPWIGNALGALDRPMHRAPGGFDRDRPPQPIERQPLRQRLSLSGLAIEQHRIAIGPDRSEEHTSELQSLMRISYAVFCLKKKKKNKT